MTAITSPTLLTIASAFALPAMSPVQITIPHPPAVFSLSEMLAISQSDTGLIVWREHNPVAWIYAGYHEGQCNNLPKRCEFVDVAYHRVTSYGVNLETSDFLDLDEALHFVANIFSPEFVEEKR